MKEPSRQSIWYAEQRDLAIEERDAAIARAEAAENERDALRALSIRVEFGGTIYNFDKALAAIPGGASIDSITVKIDDMKLVAAEKRVAELEARLAERDAEIAALTNYPNSEYGHVNY